MKRDGSREHLLFRRIKWTKNKRGGNKNKTGIPRVSALDSAVWIRARPGRRWPVKSTLLAVIYNLCCDSSSFLKNRVCVSICVCVFVWRQMTFRIVESCHCCDDDDLWADFVFLLLLSSFLSLVSFFFLCYNSEVTALKGACEKAEEEMAAEWCLSPLRPSSFLSALWFGANNLSMHHAKRQSWTANRRQTQT